ncbi:inverse autotransporter beta domain-containing protein [Vibrio harveyi]|uniref:inverse autotransporter beta domain-containing protein n=1 Tax=Vibrio harveyi TaxID=669 RepID=UPI0036F1F162
MPDFENDVAYELKLAGETIDEQGAKEYANLLEHRLKRRVNDGIEQSVSNWLSDYGTTEFDIDVFNGLNNISSSLGLLLPFYDNESQLWFSQVGYQYHNSHRYQGRDFVNLGLGFRQHYDQSMLGLNAFYDIDLSRSHRRGSVGVEYAKGYLSLSGNYYFPLSDWRVSPDFKRYLERPAKGFESKIKGYLPLYPQIGASLSYEQYFGSKVDVNGSLDPHSNPYNTTFGVEYTPFPLLAFTADYEKAKGERASLNAGISVRYRFGVPWKEQVSSEQVPLSRQLAWQWRGLVTRNNSIVLEYKEKPTFDVVASNYTVQALNAGDQYKPLTLTAEVNDLSNMGSLEFKWRIPPHFVPVSETTRVSRAQSAQFWVPPFPGVYPYSITVIQRDSGVSQTVHGTITVQATSELSSNKRLSEHVDLSASMVEFNVQFEKGAKAFKAAWDKYVRMEKQLGLIVQVMPGDSHADVSKVAVSVMDVVGKRIKLETTNPHRYLSEVQGIKTMFREEFKLDGHVLSFPVVIQEKAEGVPIIVKPITLTYGDADVAINASGGNPGASFEYQSLNTDTITVINGKVHAVKAGTGRIHVISPATDTHVEVSKELTVTVEKAEGNAITVSDIAMTYGDADVAINASGGNPGASFEYQSLNTDTITVINGKVHAVKAGTGRIHVISPATDTHVEVSKELTVTVEKAEGNAITVSDIAMTYGDADVAINASGGNPGASFEYQSLNTDTITVINGKVHAVKAGTGRIHVISPATDTHVEVSKELTVTVEKAEGNAITVSDIAMTYGDADVAINASGGNPGASFEYQSLNTDTITVINGKVHAVKAGTGRIHVISPATDTHVEVSKELTVTVEKAEGNAITVSDIAMTYGDADVAINASGGNPGVSFKYQALDPDIATVVDGKVHAVKAGTGRIRVISPATDTHNEVSKELTVTVEKAEGNAITVSDIAMTYGDADVAINASGGNPGVSFKYQALDPDIATVVDGKVHAVKAGTGRIRVISPATDTHNEVSKELTVTVEKAEGNAITVSDIAMTYGDADVAINASGGNPGASFEYQSLNTDTITVINGKVHAVKAGTGRIHVISPATDTHVEVSKELTVTVEKAEGNAITVSDIAMTYGDADVAINASGGNPGASFEYQSLNTDTITVINGKVHAVKAGTGRIRVISPATDTHVEVSKELTVTVEKAEGNAITVSDISMAFGDADVAINASGGNPGASFEYQALNPDIVTVVDGKVHAVKVGVAQVQVISPATDTHNEVSKGLIVTVEKAVNTIEVSDIFMTYGEADVAINASGGNPGASFEYQALNPDIVTVVDGKVHAVKVGVAQVQVISPATDTHNEVSKGLIVTVEKAVNTIEVSDIFMTYGEADVAINASGGNPGASFEYQSLNSDVVTVINGKVHAVKVGVAQVQVISPATDTHNEVSKELTVTVEKAEGNAITVSDISMVFGDADVAIKASGGNPGASFEYQSLNTDTITVINGKVHAVKAGLGRVRVTSLETDTHRQSSAEFIVYVARAIGNAITVSDISMAFGDADVAINASGGNPGASFEYQALDPDIVTVVDGKVHAVKVGVAQVQVISPATDTHNEVSKELIVTVEKAAGNAVTVSDISMVFGDADVAIEASGGNPGASFEYQSLNSDVVTVINGKVHAVKVGLGRVRVTSLETDTHRQSSAEFIVYVARAIGNAITVSDISMAFGDADVAINASGGNPGASFEYQALNPDIVTVVDGKVHAVKVGVAQVQVISPATDTHNEVSKGLIVTVEKAAGNAVTVSDISMVFGDADVAIEASGGNPGASFEYQSLNSDVVTVINGKVHAVKVGLGRVRVTSLETDTHRQSSAEFIVYVARAIGNAITVSDISMAFGDADVAINASGGNPGASFEYQALNPDIVTVVDGKVHAVKVGVAQVQVISPATDTHNEVSKGLIVTVEKAVNTIEVSDIFMTYGEADVAINASGGNPGASFEYQSLNSDVVTVINGKVHAVKVGVAQVQVISPATDTHNEVSKELTVTVEKAEGNAITVSDISMVFGDADVAIKASGGNPGASFEYQSLNTDTITVINGKVHAVKAGLGRVRVTSLETDTHRQSSAEFIVYVARAIGNAITVSDISMAFGDADVAINASGGNPGASFEYQALDPDIVTVVDGKVHAVKAGVAQVQVISPATDTHKKVVTKFSVNVASAASAASSAGVVRQDLKSADYVVGRTFNITFPGDIDEDSVSMSNDNATILSVSGRVVRFKLLKTGTVVLYASGNSIYYYLTIYIN